MMVVDLGAAPGRLVAGRGASGSAPRGRVIALDLLDMPGLAGVTFIRGDFRDVTVVAELERALGGSQG